MPNTSLTGLGTFNDTSKCGGLISTGVFTDSAQLLSTGEVAGNATFSNTSLCSGTVATATLNDTATITSTGVVTGNAILNNSATHEGQISGNLYLYDTATSTGTVTNNAYVAPNTTYNSSNVTGSVIPINHSNSYDNGNYWSDDSTLVVGSVMYTNRYRMDVPVSVTFMSGNASIVTDSNGVVVSDYLVAGTIISADLINQISIEGVYYSNGTYDVVANGDGTTYNDYEYAPLGVILHTSATLQYFSNGDGTYYTWPVAGTVVTAGAPRNIVINGVNYANGVCDEIADGNNSVYDSNCGGYPADGFVFVTLTTYININGTDYPNGTNDAIANGNGTVRYEYTYATEGHVFVTIGTTQYVSNGSGGYLEWPIDGTVITSGLTNYININGTDYPNGTYNVVANGTGGTRNDYTYAIEGHVFVTIGTTQYVSNGTGGYLEWPIDGTVITPGVTNYINIDNTNYSNGTYNVVANGTGGTRNEYTYAIEGHVFATIGTTQYVSNGTGGYLEWPIDGTVITPDNAANITYNGVNFSNGTYDVVANGTGGTRNEYSYPALNTLLGTIPNSITIEGSTYPNGNEQVYADGNGGVATPPSFEYISDGYPIASAVSRTIYVDSVQYPNGTVDYISNGAGGYNTDEHYPEVSTVLGTRNAYIIIEGNQYTNGTEDIVADGGGLYNVVPNHPGYAEIVFYDKLIYVSITEEGGVQAQIGTVEVMSNGSGSYLENPTQDLYPTGTLIYSNGSTSYIADGNGSYTVQT